MAPTSHLGQPNQTLPHGESFTGGLNHISPCKPNGATVGQIHIQRIEGLKGKNYIFRLEGQGMKTYISYYIKLTSELLSII